MTTVQHFVNGLKSRNRDEQNKAAIDLTLYVKTELREMPPEELALFLDDFNHHIFDMVSSSDASEKKGGVLAISEFVLNIIIISSAMIIFTPKFKIYFFNRMSHQR